MLVTALMRTCMDISARVTDNKRMRKLLSLLLSSRAREALNNYRSYCRPYYLAVTWCIGSPLECALKSERLRIIIERSMAALCRQVCCSMLFCDCVRYSRVCRSLSAPSIKATKKHTDSEEAGKNRSYIF